jgi:hypothetical protein
VTTRSLSPLAACCERRILGPFALAIAAVISGVGSVACVTENLGRRGGLNAQQIEALPPDVAKSYDLFAHKCSRCHTLARPLSANITEVGHWREYVARMRRQSGSGISADDAETILVFLKYYTDEKLRAQAEKKGPAPAAPSPPPPPGSGPSGGTAAAAAEQAEPVLWPRTDLPEPRASPRPTGTQGTDQGGSRSEPIDREASR